MTEIKGRCPHGEFDLAKGCPHCIAERRQRGILPEQDEMEAGLNKEMRGIKLTDYLSNEQITDWEELMVQIRSGSCNSINIASEKRRELMCAVDDFILAHNNTH